MNIGRIAKVCIACVVFYCMQPGQGALAQGVGATKGPQLSAQVNAYLNPLVSTHYFSGSVLVAKGSSVLLDRGFGMADEQKQRKNGPNTVFPIGSMTKAFTAVAILQLRERGRLSLHDRFCKFVPNCPQTWAPITIDELLTMTTGLPDFGFIPDEEMTSPAKAFAYLGQQKPDWKPGTRWSYNDFSYRLLGYVIEKLSGETYDGYIRQHFFKPLGMVHSNFFQNLASTPKHAIPYSGKDITPIPLPAANTLSGNMSFFSAAGGIISTTNDLRLWNRALDSTRLLSRTDLRAMFAAHVKTGISAGGAPFSSAYGYGWFVDKLYNRPVYQHRGGAGPYWSYTFRFPSQKLVLIVLCNRPDSDGDVIMTNLSRIVLTSGV